MKPINSVLHQTLTVPFYKEISGAMLFLFLVLFGAQQNMRDTLDFHYSIILSIINSNVGLLVLTILTGLYAAKCCFFIGSRLRTNQYSFLKILNSSTVSKRIIHSIFLSIPFLAPVIVYISIVFIIALKLNAVFKAILCLLLIAALIFLVIIYFIEALKKGNSVVVRRSLLPKLITFRKNITWFLFTFLFKKEIKALAIVKILSFLALFYFVKHDDQVFEERMLWLIFLLCIIGHGVIIHKCFQFLENEMRFYRNMPIKPLKVYGNLLLFYFIICLPEFWALRGLALAHDNWYSYISMITGAPLILLLLHCLLFTHDMSMDTFLPLLFGVWIVFFFFSFSENKFLIPLVALSGSLLIFFTSFKNFERENNIPPDE